MGGILKGSHFDPISCLCPILGAYRNRRKIQKIYGFKESDDGSVLAVACCTCCAVAQDAHQLYTPFPDQSNQIKSNPPEIFKPPQLKEEKLNKKEAKGTKGKSKAENDQTIENKSALPKEDV